MEHVKTTSTTHLSDYSVYRSKHDFRANRFHQVREMKSNCLLLLLNTLPPTRLLDSKIKTSNCSKQNSDDLRGVTGLLITGKACHTETNICLPKTKKIIHKMFSTGPILWSGYQLKKDNVDLHFPTVGWKWTSQLHLEISSVLPSDNWWVIFLTFPLVWWFTRRSRFPHKDTCTRLQTSLHAQERHQRTSLDFGSR